jgi:putative tryptophan/tyrosine transport system substrate-binding protein
MRRRDCLRLIGSAVGAVFLHGASSAQQRMRRLAFVHSGIPADKLTESAGPFWVRRVYQTLRELGDVEGQNLIVERFSAEGRYEQFASLAADVVSRKPDVIILNFNDLAKRFTTATSTIPLVAIIGDPIAAGLLTNLAHPGGNLTGVSINAGLEIYGKRLQLIKEAMPTTRKVVALFSGALSGMSAYEEAARQLGIELASKQLAEVNDVQLRRTFAEIAEQQFDAAIVDEGGSFLAQRTLMAALGEQYRLPVLYPYRDYVEEGGVMAYAPDLGELAQRIANDVHQILNGTKVGDIPFYQPNKFQLIINAKAARALDLPPTLVARADEVIE